MIKIDISSKKEKLKAIYARTDKDEEKIDKNSLYWLVAEKIHEYLDKTNGAKAGDKPEAAESNETPADDADKSTDSKDDAPKVDNQDPIAKAFLKKHVCIGCSLFGYPGGVSEKTKEYDEKIKICEQNIEKCEKKQDQDKIQAYEEEKRKYEEEKRKCEQECRARIEKYLFHDNLTEYIEGFWEIVAGKWIGDLGSKGKDVHDLKQYPVETIALELCRVCSEQGCFKTDDSKRPSYKSEQDAEKKVPDYDKEVMKYFFVMEAKKVKKEDAPKEGTKNGDPPKGETENGAPSQEVTANEGSSQVENTNAEQPKEGTVNAESQQKNPPEDQTSNEDTPTAGAKNSDTGKYVINLNSPFREELYGPNGAVAELKKIFSYDKRIADASYNKRNVRHRIMSALDVSVCPYCNRQYVTNYESDNDEKTSADLDHYYCKSRYPFLALSVHNFVPSCQICNSRFKLDKDFYLEEHINPHREEFGSNAKFVLEDLKILMNDAGWNDPAKCVVKLRVSPKCNDAEKIKKSIATFHLNDVYASHADYVREILWKSKVYSPELIECVGSEFRNLFQSEDQIKSLIFGQYMQEGEAGKRPLAKLTQDLLEAYGPDLYYDFDD